MTNRKLHTPGPKFKFGDLEKMKFLDILSLHGNKSRACRAVDISLSTMKRHMKEDPAFAEAVEDCLESVADDLEQEAMRRAVQGVEEKIYYGDREIGTKTVYSDSLLKTLLVAAKKEKYSKNDTVTHKGSVEHKHIGMRDSILDKIGMLGEVLDVEALVAETKALNSYKSSILDDSPLQSEPVEAELIYDSNNHLHQQEGGCEE